MSNYCPLCETPGIDFYSIRNRSYYKCPTCSSIFMDHQNRPDELAEKTRYEEHINDVNNKGYQRFVSPITNAVLRDFSADDQGLDFGAGTGPVIAKMLFDEAYKLELYDPFFHDNPELLKQTYDYIVSCEVIEHFYYPDKEFRLLKSLLKPGGKLYCMTDLYHEEIDFNKWYYKNDLTHVFIYHKETILWIKEKYGFADVEIEDRLITFSV